MGRNGAAHTTRTTYRHGDLRNALIRFGLELAHESGPHAVQLREAARRAGVVPNAAYRHFRDREALLEAIRSAALAELALAIEAELAQLDPSRPVKQRATERLFAIGRGYLRFALSHPGWFRAAVSTSGQLEGVHLPERRGASGQTAFELMGSALDDLVAVGELLPENRPGAELILWSAVHGLALLHNDGPLHQTEAPQIEQIQQRLMQVILRGLTQ